MRHGWPSSREPMLINNPIFAIGKLTCLELLQNRAMRSLMAFLLLFPFASFIFTNLFLMDIGKVFVDAMAGLSHLVGIVYILFFAAPLLARDIEARVCYFLLTPPVSRNQYLLGRFAGISTIFILLLVVLSITGTLCAWLVLEGNFAVYHSGLTLSRIAVLAFFQFFHYISLLGIALFIFSWASGMAEIMLFTSLVTLLCWVFPPIIQAMQNPEVVKDIPLWITQLLDAVYGLLPHLNGSEIALALAHGVSIGAVPTTYYALEHISYAVIAVILSMWLFSKRDL